MDIIYKPTRTGLKFMQSDARMRVICGPVGSAKSTLSCFEIVRRASMQEPDKRGLRRTRALVVRETARQLADTTIHTWLDWFPDGVCGRFMRTTKTYFLKIGDVECEIMFRALDDSDDVANLNSLEVTFAWMNECRDIHPDIVDGLSKRIGRFPSAKDGGPTWFGMWGDTNPPTMDTWWHNMMENIDPSDGVSYKETGWEVFHQPSGRSPEAENIENLPEGYYDTKGRSEEYIRVYIDGEYGTSLAGKPVFKYFRPDYHMAKGPLNILDGGVRPVVVGVDLGLCYSDDTEVLTESGWKLFADVDEHKDRVATLNPGTMLMEYTDIRFKVAKPWVGDMVHFHGQNMDLMVTPEHRTPFTHRDTPDIIRWTSAEDLADVRGTHRYLQLSGRGTAVDTGVNFFGLPDDLACEFMGWYLSEGGVYQGSENSFRVEITQKKPAPDLAEMVAHPAWADIGVTWYREGDTQGWRMSHAGIGRRVQALGKQKVRQFPREFLRASKENLRRLLHTFVRGDGHIRTKAKKDNGVGPKVREEMTAFTTSPFLRDGVQTAAALAGWNVTCRFDPGRLATMKDGRRIAPSPGWTLAFKRFERAEILKRNVSRVPYDGMVYCLNVPFHTLYVRRNGRAMWNGNTPACVFMQMDAMGRVLVLDECVSFDMGIQRFIRTLVKPKLFERFAAVPALVVCDPAGVQRAQTDERTAVDIIRAEGLRVIPAKTNRITARLAAVDDLLMRQVEGGPAFLVDQRCRHLKAALMGGYRYNRKGETIEKNDHSHVADALQYGCLHIMGAEGENVAQRRPVRRVSALGWT